MTAVISRARKGAGRLSLGCAALALAAHLLSGQAWAHGSVSMEEDTCKLRVGRYLMHFAGFQPDTPSGPQEFCEDIPEPASTIIVLDYIDAELRDMPTEVRIVRAAEEDKDLERATVFYLPARLYPTGSLSLETKLEAGDYVGLVTVGEGEKLRARFPFAVGRKGPSWHLYLLAVPVLAGGLYWVGLRQRRQQRKAV